MIARYLFGLRGKPLPEAIKPDAEEKVQEKVRHKVRTLQSGD
ncbi:MAG: hypothetical protein OD918_05845 [Gammaproteobacteria bacterium]